MRRIVALFLLAASLCFAVASADLPDKWRSWRYSRAITGSSSATDSPATLELPWDLYAHCEPECSDIRILNLQGAEVPYEMVQKRPSASTANRATRVIENSFVFGQYTQVIGDLGEARTESFDRVMVETSLPNFIVWAEVALSDDAKTWRVVEPRAPISRFRSRAVEGTQTIPIQALSSRYIRVRVANASEKFPVDGLRVLREESRSFPAKEVPAEFSQHNSSDAAITVWQTTLSSSNQPISEIHLSTTTAEFYRAVRVSASNDGQEWSYLGSGVVYRYKQGDKVRGLLAVECSETSGWRIVRVELVNGNDQPLENAAFTLFAAPSSLLFKRTAGQQYRLIYGNERASMPQYDLAHYLDFDTAKPIYVVLSLGPEEQTANFRDPRPFTERHPEILWTALGIAVVLIGLTAIRTLRTPAKSAHQS